MVRALGEFILGAAVIISPACRVPVLIGSTTFTLGKTLAKRSRARKGQQLPPRNGADKQVAIEWDQLSADISSKKSGKRRVILKNLQGSAQPGR